MNHTFFYVCGWPAARRLGNTMMRCRKKASLWPSMWTLFGLVPPTQALLQTVLPFIFPDGCGNNKSEVVNWPPNSPNLYPVEQRWDLGPICAGPTHRSETHRSVLTSGGQKPQRTFRGLGESMPPQVGAKRDQHDTGELGLISDLCKQQILV